ncbi:condensation domain-containing protein (plasmid) [Streptomyces sp. NBC_00727]|uniref:condensation domain-containing protein n=1 Tax=Streptomyces sp. NBC_00727 TaxID=2903675 RepID=UPI002F907ABD
MPTRTPSEALLDLAADVMGLDARTLAARAAGSPFITLGGTFDRAARLRLRAGETLGLGLELHQLMGPAPLADVLDCTVPAAPPALPQPSSAWRPLLPGQRAALGSGHRAYRVLSAELSGPLDVNALRTALDALCDRHEGLRTVFATYGDGAGRRVLDRHPGPLAGLSRTAPGPDPVAAAHSRLAAELRQVAGQPGRPPVAFALAMLGPGRHLLSFVHHEAVADGFSAALVWRELLAGYERVVRGSAPGYAAAPGPDAVEAAGADAGTVPGAAPRFSTERLAFALDDALRDAVDATARRAGVPHSCVLLAAWALVLGRDSGADAVPVGVELPRHPGAAPVRAVAGCGAQVSAACELEGTTDYFLRGVACAFGEALGRLREEPPGVRERGTAHALAPAPVLFAARDEWLPARAAYGGLTARFHHAHLGTGPAQAALTVLRWRDDPLLCLDFAPAVIQRDAAVRLVAEVRHVLEALVRARAWAPVDDLLARSGAPGTAPFPAAGTVPLPLC